MKVIIIFIANLWFEIRGFFKPDHDEVLAKVVLALERRIESCKSYYQLQETFKACVEKLLTYNSNRIQFYHNYLESSYNQRLKQIQETI